MLFEYCYVIGLWRGINVPKQRLGMLIVKIKHAVQFNAILCLKICLILLEKIPSEAFLDAFSVFHNQSASLLVVTKAASDCCKLLPRSEHDSVHCTVSKKCKRRVDGAEKGRGEEEGTRG